MQRRLRRGIFIGVSNRIQHCELRLNYGLFNPKGSFRIIKGIRHAKNGSSTKYILKALIQVILAKSHLLLILIKGINKFIRRFVRQFGYPGPHDCDIISGKKRIQQIGQLLVNLYLRQYFSVKLLPYKC